MLRQCIDYYVIDCHNKSNQQAYFNPTERPKAIAKFINLAINQ